MQLVCIRKLSPLVLIIFMSLNKEVILLLGRGGHDERRNNRDVALFIFGLKIAT